MSAEFKEVISQPPNQILNLSLKLATLSDRVASLEGFIDRFAAGVIDGNNRYTHSAAYDWQEFRKRAERNQSSPPDQKIITPEPLPPPEPPPPTQQITITATMGGYMD